MTTETAKTMKCPKCDQFYVSGEPLYEMADGSLAHVECPVRIERVASYKKPDPEVEREVMEQFSAIFDNPDAPWNQQAKKLPEVIGENE